MEKFIKKRRLFIAINLPQELKNELGDLLDKLQGQYGGGIKWVNTNILHFTLHFLGDVSELNIKLIKKIIQSLSGNYGQMEFEIKKISAYPNTNFPRVIFLSCEQINSNTIFKLQKELSMRLVKIGLDTDKRHWEAHITLGRVKRDIPGISKIFTQNLKLNNLKFKVNTFELMESELKPDGAEYKIIESYIL